MRWTITVRADGGGPVEAEVEAGTDATVGEVADELAKLVRASSPALFLDDHLLDPHLLLRDSGISPGCTVWLGRAGPPSPPAITMLELWVRGGPDAGRRHRLTTSRVVVGRGDQADVRLHDPDVSSAHAEFAIERGGVTVRDLGSSNGTRVDGIAVDERAVHVAVGARIEMGESELTVADPRVRPAAVRARSDGSLLVNRAPRVTQVPVKRSVTLPVMPPPRPSSRLSIVSAVLPLAMGIAMAAALHAVVYLLFAALSPMLLLSSAVIERRGAHRGRRRALAEHRARQEVADRRLSEAIAAEGSERHAANPDLAMVAAVAARPGRQLWERLAADADALVVRLGRADVPARLTVGREDGRPEDSPILHATPVTIDLKAARVIGVAGPAAMTDSMLRAIVVQLAVWHGPSELTLAVIADDDAASDWRWARWLPHVGRADGSLRMGGDPAGRRDLVDQLLRDVDVEDRPGPATTGHHMVVVLQNVARLQDLPGLDSLLDSQSRQIHVLCAAERVDSLPRQCCAVVEQRGEASTRCRVDVSAACAVDDVVADGMPAEAAETVARALARFSDRGEDRTGQLPTTASLLDQPGVSLGNAEIAAGRTTVAIIGECAQGPFSIDLARDGPHALIAGTTGSGKSELLQTIVASLALANRPDALNFVLIDYKGGAAFHQCEQLPHTVGMVTDLDHHLTERALTSLSAELKRREQLLARVGAKDLEAYWQAVDGAERPASGPGGPPLARLVLVVDEFATLVEELPDFVNGLVGIAMRGRSLGVHLILATQRPSGVVSPVIRANTNLRIALRVTDEAESADVIGTPAAARIAKTQPGRAFVRIGSEPLIEFQAARVAGRTPEPQRRPRVWLNPWPATPRTRSTPDEPAQTDLQRIAAATALAAQRVGAPAPPSPWLPPLPELVTVAELSDGDAPYGLADCPAAQRRQTASLQFGASSAIAVAGGPRSGRTTALRTLITSAAARHPPDDLHVYVLDCAGGGLHVAEDLPHCGAVCGRHDVARGERVLTRLAAEIDFRLGLLARNDYTSVAEQRAHARADRRLPWLLLAIDGWEPFEAAYGAIDHGRLVDVALRLAREGGAAGLHVVVTGDRALLTARSGAAMPTKLVLRMSDRSDYLAAGLRARDVPDTMPDGRAVLIESGPARGNEPVGPVEVQVAVLDADLRSAAQTAAVRAAAESARALATNPARLPFTVCELPRRVRRRDLRAVKLTSPLSVAVGLAGDEAEPAVVNVAADGPGFLIAGPPRSGVTTALATMASALIDNRVTVAVVASRRSALHRLAGRPQVAGVFGPEDVDGLLPALATRPLIAIVDDAHTLTDSPAADALAELLRRDDGQCAVIAGGRSDQLSMTFRGLTVPVRQSRSGILLQPSRSDGELLGAVLPHMAATPLPGRGVLVADGVATPVQVAADDADLGLASHPDPLTTADQVLAANGARG
jgi:S-DNA-T family DNA segregation ATPase FtsK/SpoIIIE